MSEKELNAEQIADVTSYVDVEAPPQGPTAHLIFGTNQDIPATLAVDRYHRGLAPRIILTGGVNRHNGIVEARMFRSVLIAGGVPDSAIRYEDTSKNTWQNVEFALPALREAMEDGLSVTAVCKWYHRRAIHVLRTLVPEIGRFHAVTWEPIYAGASVTRSSWPDNPEGRPRVLREWQEVPRRIAEGTFTPTVIVDGAWK